MFLRVITAASLTNGLAANFFIQNETHKIYFDKLNCFSVSS